MLFFGERGTVQEMRATPRPRADTLSLDFTCLKGSSFDYQRDLTVALHPAAVQPHKSNVGEEPQELRPGTGSPCGLTGSKWTVESVSMKALPSASEANLATFMHICAPSNACLGALFGSGRQTKLTPWLASPMLPRVSACLETLSTGMASTTAWITGLHGQYMKISGVGSPTSASRPQRSV